MSTKKREPYRVGDKPPTAKDNAKQRRKAQGKAKRETVASVHAQCERLRQALTVHQQRVAGDVARLHGDVSALRTRITGAEAADAVSWHPRILNAEDFVQRGLWRRLRWLFLGC